MKTFFLPAALLLGIAALGSCSRDDGPSNTAGTGGPAALRVSVTHHAATIDSGRVRIKYNADSQPSNGAYDDSVQIQKLGTVPAQALFSGLKPGRYYLSAYAWDNNVVPGKATLVVGGLPFVITDTTVSRSVLVPVTEADGSGH